MAPTAPPIGGQSWINCDPVNPDQLRGRVAVLVFWSAGCEASLRQVQRVQTLVATLTATPDSTDTNPSDGSSKGPVAVAVHSPRLPFEDDVEFVEQTIARHRITIPVVHDPRFESWNRYEPPGWPSTAVIDRNGRVTGIAAGCHDDRLVSEAVRTALADRIRPRRLGYVRRASGRRQTDETTEHTENTENAVTIELFPPASIDLDPDRPAAELVHPEGVALAAGSDRPLMAVADTGRDRVLFGHVDEAGGRLLVDVEVNGLTQPTALAMLDQGRLLVVVERGANTVAAVDPHSGRLTMISERLVRPSAVSIDADGSVVICDGGGDMIHRAVANSAETGYLVAPIAGSGRTGTSPGDAAVATLAQPSAVVRIDAGLVFADAASHNLRLLSDDGTVVNITDGGPYDAGLVDGPAHRARLLRPSGLCRLPDGSILVADSGNGRLRMLADGHLHTVGLGGMSWPSALAAANGTVIVADTGHHRLLQVDLGGRSARPVTIDMSESRSVQVSSGSMIAAT